MRNFIPALILTLTTSAALAQAYPPEASTTSSQRVVVEAVNLTRPRLTTIPQPQQAPAAVLPATAGIGPSSNMPQPGDYGYSYISDLRQLNF